MQRIAKAQIGQIAAGDVGKLATKQPIAVMNNTVYYANHTNTEQPQPDALYSERH